MPLPGITFNRGQGGLNRTAPGEDHISGLLFFSDTLPAGYTDNTVVKEYVDLSQAETDGIIAGSANFGVFHYHISEFFRINPSGKVFVRIAAVPAGAYNFIEVVDMQNFAEGKIRQFGVYVTSGGVLADISNLQLKANQLDSEFRPANILYSGNALAGSISIFLDLRTFDSPKVSAIIGQDGAGVGKALYDSTSDVISCLGAALGAVSLSSVSESIAWVAKFDMSKLSTELDVPMLTSGDFVKDLSPAVLDTLNDKGYVFLLRHIGLDGTYFNDSHTAEVVTSDYANIENNRTIDKAIRGIRTGLLPALNGPVKVDPDTGKLAFDTVKYFESLASSALEQMERDSELSGFLVSIDPSQDVLTTSNVVVDVDLVPIGVARTITVNVGFVVSLNQ